MKKFLLALDLQHFADGDVGDTGVDVGSAAETQTGGEVTPSDTTVTDTSTGEETNADAQNNFEKAFAKRLSAKQSEWEAQKNAEIQTYQEKLKDFDHYKRAADYLQKSADLPDLLSLSEQIELVELQDRAERENVPVDVLKRITQLEAKEQQWDAFQQKQAIEQEIKGFRTTLEAFAAEKGANPDELHNFMFHHQIANHDLAYKAMRAEQLEAQLGKQKEDVIKEYLDSKKAPRVEGSGVAMTQGVDTSKMSWDELDRHAAARLRAANNPT